MKDRSQAALFTTYINLSPNLPKTIFGENTARFFVTSWLLRMTGRENRSK